MNCIPVPPPLEIDKVLYKNEPMALHVRVERRIVWNLLLTLEKIGFIPHSVYDGDESTSATSKKAAMELMFNLDDAVLYLSHSSGEKNSNNRLRTVWVRFVFGNGIDVVSDYNASSWNNFQEEMEKFESEVYA